MQTALIYLLIGVILGVVIGTDPMLAVRFRFVHIHLNLLGFMVMFIAGVAYHVLPRFTARTMPWPAGVTTSISKTLGYWGCLARS